MYYSFRGLIFSLCLSIPFLTNGQGTGNSPFSQFGVGDIVGNNGNIRSAGMGYAGVSSRNPLFINFINPALVTNLRTAKKSRLDHIYKAYYHYRNMKIDTTVKIDFALNYQNRSIQTPLGYEKAAGVNVAYLTFAMPLSKAWGTAFGIVPFSTVNYNLAYTTPIIGKPSSTASIQNSGKGGIYKIFLSNGVGLSQNLSVGLETALLYGNINNEYFSTISDLSTKSFGFKRQSNYSAFEFKPGIQFRKEIAKDTVIIDKEGRSIPKTKSTGVFYSVGLTYELFSSMNITRSLNLYVLDATNHISLDTTVQTSKYKTQLPSTARLGFSLDAPLRWALAADVFYSPWANYKSGFSSDTLANSYGFNVGGEYTISYLKPRCKTVRAGFTYLKTPVIYNNQQLDDVSFSLGTTIPLGKKRRDKPEEYMMPVRPTLNFAFVFGQRGNVNTFGIKEQYIKVYASFMIHQKWFTKSKIY